MYQVNNTDGVRQSVYHNTFLDETLHFKLKIEIIGVFDAPLKCALTLCQSVTRHKEFDYSGESKKL
jgi:hypothetical protein